MRDKEGGKIKGAIVARLLCVSVFSSPLTIENLTNFSSWGL